MTARRSALLLATLAAACAETTAPLPPPVELLLVVNAGAPSLGIVTLAGEPSSVALALGRTAAPGARPIAGRRYAVVATGGGDTVTVVDVIRRAVTREIGVGAGADARGGAIVRDTLAFVALAGRGQVLRINLVSGDTASLPAGNHPQDIALARGRLFVINANLVPCSAPEGFCPAGDSWVSVLDPVAGVPSTPRDSIPLPGSRHAAFATLGADGRLYVMSVGGPDEPAGRLSIVDPIARTEVGNFGGFGDSPGQIAADRGERIYISSRSEGLMVFNLRARAIERGAGSGIPVVANAGVAVDAHNQVYGIEAGSCAGGTGRARVFRPDLTEARTITLGSCAATAATALILPEAEPDGS